MVPSGRRTAGARWTARGGVHWIGLLLVSACAPSPQEEDALGRYLMESLAFARQTADTATLEELFLPDATYDDDPTQIQYRGVAEIVGYLTSVHTWGDDVYFNLGNVVTGPSVAVGEWFMAAVQTRPVPDIVSTTTGREVVLTGITLVEIENGRIARAADYSDRAAMLLQLGARIEMPDGAVMEGAGPPDGEPARR